MKFSLYTTVFNYTQNKNIYIQDSLSVMSSNGGISS